MKNTDLLKASKWMALFAIVFCSIATLIAYFSISSLEFIMIPLLGIGIFIWVLSVVWFLWGWLKNADEVGNERKGVVASSYILAFLPLCYCFLLATDESRTKITVDVLNEFKPIHSVKIYGSGTIFLKPDTLKLAGLASGERARYLVKAATAPHMRGEVIMEGFLGDKKFKKQIAGPFSIEPMDLKTNWDFRIKEDILNRF
jgi:hypothetical protein